MSTGISYCDETWNPVCGCPLPLVSPGCEKCWARACHNMRYKAKQAGKNVKGRMFDKPFEVLQFFPKLLDQPLHWKKPRVIFAGSQTDLFHPEVSFEIIGKIFGTAIACDWHKFLFLTKRPDRMLEFEKWFNKKTSLQLSVLKNIYLGLTICNQEEADEKIPILLQIPAAHRFLSIEPLLGPVNLSKDIGGTLWVGGQRGCGSTHRGIGTPDCPREPHHHHDNRCNNGIDQVIVGCESGPGARLCKLEWIESIVNQCAEAGVKTFVKQIPFKNKISTEPSSHWPISLRQRSLIWR
jgi:protein gp37